MVSKLELFKEAKNLNYLKKKSFEERFKNVADLEATTEKVPSSGNVVL